VVESLLSLEVEEVGEVGEELGEELEELGEELEELEELAALVGGWCRCNCFKDCLVDSKLSTNVPL
jgi:hypothetical protein